MNQLSEPRIREDYRILLDLAVIFLSDTPICGIIFWYPGAIIHVC